MNFINKNIKAILIAITTIVVIQITWAHFSYESNFKLCSPSDTDLYGKVCGYYQKQQKKEFLERLWHKQVFFFSKEERKNIELNNINVQKSIFD